VPDIAMDADPNTGMLIGQTQTFPDSVHYGEYRIGGTSLASPLLAGMLALSIEKNGGKPFGQLNPRLYAAKGIATDVVAQPNQPGVVRADYVNGLDPADGVSYTIRTFGQDSSLPVSAGWDPVTGIGVPSTGIFNLGTSTAAAARG
jgi:subtilase family serine protease